MLQCWKYDPNERPSFTELVDIIQSRATAVENYADEIGNCVETDRGYECSEDSNGANNDVDSLDTVTTRHVSFPQETCPPSYNSQSQSESYRTGSSDSGIMNEYMEPKCQVLWHGPPDDLDYIRTTVI